MRGISLEEISASTKIGTRSLRAIEAEDFEKLPGGIFNKGFVRAYSRFLGLDEEQTVADFEAAWTAFEAARGPVLALPSEQETAKESAQSAWLLVIVLVVLAAIAAGWYLFQRSRLQKLTFSPAPAQTSQADPDSLSKPSVPGAAAPASSADTNTTNEPAAGLDVAKSSSPEPASPPASVAKQSQSASNAPTSSPSAPIQLQVFAREDSWLSVFVDGKNLGQGILSAQKSRSIRAQKEVRLKVGNLAGVQVSFNGEPVDVDGQAKEVKELIFTTQGLQR